MRKISAREQREPDPKGSGSRFLWAHAPANVMGTRACGAVFLFGRDNAWTIVTVSNIMRYDPDARTGEDGLLLFAYQ